MKKLRILQQDPVLKAEFRLVKAVGAIESGESRITLWGRAGQLLGEVESSSPNYRLNISGVKPGRSYEIMLLAAIDSVVSDDIRHVVTGSAYVLGRSCVD